MSTIDEGAGQPPIKGAQQPARKMRADAQRNEQTLLDAAAAVFVMSGIEAQVRDIAAAAGVGMGTIYRHFHSSSIEWRIYESKLVKLW